MTGADRLGLASVVASLAAGATLAPLTQDRTYLLLALALMLPSMLIGALLRRARAGEVVVRLAQLLPVLAVPWLVPAVRDPFELYAETREFVQVAFAPMPFQPGFALFSALLLWVVYLLVETLAIGLASPAWTFPVLVLPYLIPALAIYAETSPFLFCFVAAGYALLLATATTTTLPLPRGSDEETSRGWRRAVAATAALSTAAALTATVLLSLPIPERTRTGNDPGGSGSVQLGDPSLDLIRNVNSNSDQVLLTYRTSDGDGQYLRLTALPVFGADGFHLTGTDLVPLPFGTGRPASAGRTVTTAVQVGNLGSEYLPMPWFPVGTDVAGDRWRYDPITRAVVAIGTNRSNATRQLAYEAQSARLPDSDALLPTLREVGDPQDGGVTLALPDEVSPDVRRLAQQVTANAGSVGEQALALAEFLRSDAFTYSTAAGAGTTLGTLDDFLLGSRTGYCEQFAGSLAVLARVVGIPSRVVVGFLPGKKVGDRWEVTARNMHAWTELYFGDGQGWVAVDATPSGAAGGPRPSASATPSASPSSAQPSVQPTSAATSVAPQVPAAGAGGGPWGAIPWVLSGAGVLGLVAVGPRLVRAGLRRFRLAGSKDPRRATERAWSEVRAATRDLGRDWPGGTSRQVAAELVPQLPGSGGEALLALATVVERSRYDREPTDTDGLADRARTITAAMAEEWRGSGARPWWPRSLWPQRD